MIKIKITDRYNITAFRSFITNILSLFTGLVVIGIIFLIAGVNPVFAISEMFTGSFGSLYGFKETITKAIPLILIGAGLTRDSLRALGLRPLLMAVALWIFVSVGSYFAITEGLIRISVPS